MDERASEGEDADLDDAEDFAAEESEVDDEATLEEEEVISANNDAWPVHSEIWRCRRVLKGFILSHIQMKSAHSVYGIQASSARLGSTATLSDFSIVDVGIDRNQRITHDVDFSQLIVVSIKPVTNSFNHLAWKSKSKEALTWL